MAHRFVLFLVMILLVTEQRGVSASDPHSCFGVWVEMRGFSLIYVPTRGQDKEEPACTVSTDTRPKSTVGGGYGWFDCQYVTKQAQRMCLVAEYQKNHGTVMMYGSVTGTKIAYQEHNTGNQACDILGDVAVSNDPAYTNAYFWGHTSDGWEIYRTMAFVVEQQAIPQTQGEDWSWKALCYHSFSKGLIFVDNTGILRIAKESTNVENMIIESIHGENGPYQAIDPSAPGFMKETASVGCLAGLGSNLWLGTCISFLHSGSTHVSVLCEITKLNVRTTSAQSLVEPMESVFRLSYDFRPRDINKFPMPEITGCSISDYGDISFKMNGDIYDYQKAAWAIDKPYLVVGRADIAYGHQQFLSFPLSLSQKMGSVQYDSDTCPQLDFDDTCRNCVDTCGVGGKCTGDACTCVGDFSPPDCAESSHAYCHGNGAFLLDGTCTCSHHYYGQRCERFCGPPYCGDESSYCTEDGFCNCRRGFNTNLDLACDPTLQYRWSEFTGDVECISQHRSRESGVFGCTGSNMTIFATGSVDECAELEYCHLKKLEANPISLCATDHACLVPIHNLTLSFTDEYYDNSSCIFSHTLLSVSHQSKFSLVERSDLYHETVQRCRYKASDGTTEILETAPRYKEAEICWKLFGCLDQFVLSGLQRHGGIDYHVYQHPDVLRDDDDDDFDDDENSDGKGHSEHLCCRSSSTIHPPTINCASYSIATDVNGEPVGLLDGTNPNIKNGFLATISDVNALPMLELETAHIVQACFGSDQPMTEQDEDIFGLFVVVVCLFLTLVGVAWLWTYLRNRRLHHGRRSSVSKDDEEKMVEMDEL